MKTMLLRDKSDWAMIVVDQDYGLTVIIHSVFGNWAFTWSQPGEDAVKFLEYTSVDYSFGKFSNILKLALPNKYVAREMNSYKTFYEKFWGKMIDELKTS